MSHYYQVGKSKHKLKEDHIEQNRKDIENFILKKVFKKINLRQNKEERYSRVPRLSDTRFSAKGTKGKWR